jgi:hypothetical protein
VIVATVTGAHWRLWPNGHRWYVWHRAATWT